MSDVTFRVVGLSEFRVWLAELANPAILRNAVRAAAMTLERRFKAYPPVRRLTRKAVYGRTFESDKQRRFFFWALRAGVIEVPYYRGQNVRSENLQQSWTTESLSDTAAAVGTQVSYAPMQMDATRQTRYAKAVGWRTVQSHMADGAAEVGQVLEAGISKALKGVQ